MTTKIGIIGCGNVNRLYGETFPRLPNLQIVACADVNRAAAEKLAAWQGIPRALSPEELLTDPEVEIVLNLTTPASHAEIALAALEAGKHVYNEKPLALAREDGKKIVATARAKGLLVGCAPDTFLGAGIQTCKKLIEDGEIGQLVGATAFMLCPGHESWHPSPAFYYQPGGGPMFDMGPYYLTALVTLLGPVRRVTGSVSTPRAERLITSQPRAGTVIPVEVPTHVTGVLDFVSGAVGTIITSFDVHASTLPPIEIYGTTGSIRVPDPNSFGGPVYLRRAGEREWANVPLAGGPEQQSRGVGLSEMAEAIRSGGSHRANGDLALHVLDIMHAIHEASASERHIKLTY
ncbi:MAG: Gfo/Idh/MocA family oxidoreductase [Anaerolineales bacterium]